MKRFIKYPKSVSASSSVYAASKSLKRYIQPYVRDRGFMRQFPELAYPSDRKLLLDQFDEVFKGMFGEAKYVLKDIDDSYTQDNAFAFIYINGEKYELIFDTSSDPAWDIYGPVEDWDSEDD